MSAVEVDDFFTPEERSTIVDCSYRFASGQICLDTSSRPFLNLGAKGFLISKGLDPHERAVLEQLGRVWGFYEIFDQIKGRLEALRDPADFIASQLGIQSETLAKGQLSPGQKFRILSEAVDLCYRG
ncbi:MAG: hypothetical protein PHE48_02290 [Candidatus Daviesbacteria bacterium]|nr:hypothetical protein [Candidatus Daviesbacteria bacterium]